MTNRVNRDLFGLAARDVKKAVFSLPKPWEKKKEGRPAHDPRIVVCLLVLKALFNYTYDTAESNLTKSSDLKRILGMEKLPGHSVLYRGMQKLSQEYIRRLNKRLTVRFRRRLGRKVDIALDSSGFRTKTSSHWFDIRVKRRNSRKDNEKLHIACDVNLGLIWNYCITDYKAHDSPFLKSLLSVFTVLRYVMGDAAYPSRDNCKEVAKKGGKPFLMPRKNSSPRPKGSKAWRDMINDFLHFMEYFLGVYHMRSCVESVFSSLKRRFGNFLRSVKKRVRRRELALKVLAYNVKQSLYVQTADELGVPLWIPCE